MKNLFKEQKQKQKEEEIIEEWSSEEDYYLISSNAEGRIKSLAEVFRIFYPKKTRKELFWLAVRVSFFTWIAFSESYVDRLYSKDFLIKVMAKNDWNHGMANFYIESSSVLSYIFRASVTLASLESTWNFMQHQIETGQIKKNWPKYLGIVVLAVITALPGIRFILDKIKGNSKSYFITLFMVGAVFRYIRGLSDFFLNSAEVKNKADAIKKGELLTTIKNSLFITLEEKNISDISYGKKYRRRKYQCLLTVPVSAIVTFPYIVASFISTRQLIIDIFGKLGWLGSQDLVFYATPAFSVSLVIAVIAAGSTWSLYGAGTRLLVDRILDRCLNKPLFSKDLVRQQEKQSYYKLLPKYLLKTFGAIVFMGLIFLATASAAGKIDAKLNFRSLPVMVSLALGFISTGPLLGKDMYEKIEEIIKTTAHFIYAQCDQWRRIFGTSLASFSYWVVDEIRVGSPRASWSSIKEISFKGNFLAASQTNHLEITEDISEEFPLLSKNSSDKKSGWGCCHVL